ncbi:hypothetical protein [Bradyrhizobium sp. 187]|uniref:hypothetical protein n=1 Tax=Bradyrhizobium sp. 187 TaxID=2782655 RepID=UPI001FFE7853|nr:hypothetical protein [Bradyrhizobium sp. 187]UPJ69885.1 hypothetical protein IVB19_19295 [Bradyrhizobium sp. 187]
MKLDGITDAMCPNECSAEGCVISGKPYCAHPRKGGLHHQQLQSDHAALSRLQEARETLSRA